MGAARGAVAQVTGLAVEIDEKRFDGDPVLGAIAFRLALGERATLLGPSGIGKSTLLGILAGTDTRFAGRVDRPPGRVAVVFQTPRLLPWRTLAENIALIPGAGDLARARALLEEVGLGEAVDMHPEKVSVGMQRRAALARALAVDPGLLLLDEPLVSLDPDSAAAMRDVLRLAMERSGAVVLMATHDRTDALALTDRVLELGGRPARIVRDRANPVDRVARRDAAAIARVPGDWFAPPAGRACTTE